MEGNSNEPWPNHALNRDWRDNTHNESNSSWPVNSMGAKVFWANERYGKPTGFPPFDQEKQIVRNHRGNGPVFSETQPNTIQYRIVDIFTDPKNSQDPPLVEFIQTFAGRYGTYAPAPTGFYDNDCPPGPPFQPRMWDRQFRGSSGGEPIWLEYRGEHRNGNPNAPAGTGEDPRVYRDSQPKE